MDDSTTGNITHEIITEKTSVTSEANEDLMTSTTEVGSGNRSTIGVISSHQGVTNKEFTKHNKTLNHEHQIHSSSTQINEPTSEAGNNLETTINTTPTLIPEVTESGTKPGNPVLLEGSSTSGMIIEQTTTKEFYYVDKFKQIIDDSVKTKEKLKLVEEDIDKSMKEKIAMSLKLHDVHRSIKHKNTIANHFETFKKQIFGTHDTIIDNALKESK